MAKIITAATDLFTPVEIDLWGRVYTVAEPTRKVERELAAAFEAADKLPDDAPDDQAFAATVETLDIMLEPVPVEDGKKLRAKTHLTTLFKAEKIGTSHVLRLIDVIGNARDVNNPN